MRLKKIVRCFAILLRLIGKIVYRFFIMPLKKSMLENCGRHVLIGIGTTMTYANVSIGDNSSVGSNSLFLSSNAKIKVGRNVMFGPAVTIVTGDHRLDVIGAYMINVTEKLPENDIDVIIEEDVWVGCNVTILKGVTIGRGSVIAAGSLVTKDVEPYNIYGGVPAKKLKARFSADEIEEHERILYANTK